MITKRNQVLEKNFSISIGKIDKYTNGKKTTKYTNEQNKIHVNPYSKPKYLRLIFKTKLT